ncbi:MAG: hypothetical protein HYT38_00250 [Candidatus Sungbacteria bacterium]|uniref:30S ribosomal protein S21 n=1 Tax=Candidatus Sungiibacteriota bacterium TaxID=2750080 RepID=A0A931YDI7_9BACT|nr:hypothetical protein [Candidatus Sungbacteria bacterium]MBI2465949.1 hypothetical protein [Candidatus Sungbacteria bacterium]
MIELRKKEKESTLNLLRRFTKKVRQSGVLLKARQNKFRLRAKNKRKVKDSALRRERLRALRAEMSKLGEIKPGEKMDLSKIKRKR